MFAEDVLIFEILVLYNIGWVESVRCRPDHESRVLFQAREFVSEPEVDR